MEKDRASWKFDVLAGVVAILLAVSLSGCGSSGSYSPSNPSGSISVALTQMPPSSLATGLTATISATVSNDSANGGVDWTCAPAGSCGSFNPAHTASGATTTYTAPSAGGTITITATSTTNHTAAAVATVTVASNAVSISLTTAPPATLAASATAPIAATVTNDTANAGVDWTCAPAGSCGSFNPAHTASAAATTYTAPGTGGSVTITATSTSTHSATAVATIAVTASVTPVTISAITGAPATLAVGGTAAVSATVTNDGANAGVDWTCTPTGTCGTFNPAHTASGANTTYTAPNAAIAAVITATATSSATAKSTTNIAVAAVNAATLTAGNYSFYASGEDSKKNSYAIAGVITLAANGTINGGVQDYVSFGGATSPEPGGDTITGGTWTVTGNGLGTLTLITNNALVGVAGTETFSIAEVNSKHAVIGEFDAGATSSGSLDLQTPTGTTLAQLNSSFAFVVSGKNGAKSEAFGGFIDADGAGNVHVTVDQNEGGSITRAGSNVGTYTAADAAGRGTMTFGGSHFVYYVVNAKVLRLVTIDANNPDVGSAYAALANIAPVTNAALTHSFVFTDASNLSAGATFAAAGKLTMDGSGNITSGFADVDENGTATSSAVTGTYSVNAAGYGTITLTPGATQDVSVLGLYLVDPTINFADPNSPADGVLAGLLLDLDTKIVGNGVLILPAAGAQTFTGNYTLSTQSSNTNEADSVGVVAVSGTSVSGVENLNNLLFATGQGSAIALSGTLTPDAVNVGRFTIPVLASLTTPVTSKYVLYQVGSTQFVLVQVDSPQFASGTLQKQQ